jgi:hypothetical protein
MVCSVEDDFAARLRRRAAPRESIDREIIAVASNSGCATGFYSSSHDPGRERGLARIGMRGFMLLAHERAMLIVPPKNNHSAKK